MMIHAPWDASNSIMDVDADPRLRCYKQPVVNPKASFNYTPGERGPQARPQSERKEWKDDIQGCGFGEKNQKKKQKKWAKGAK